MNRCGFVFDYQNMNLVGSTLFASQIGVGRNFVSPIKIAQAVIGGQLSEILDIRVFRGLPSNQREPKKYALNMRQKSLWEKDGPVSVHHVPLKYRWNDLPPQEKGVDVLAAVHLFEMSESGEFDVLYLCSHDSDFIPVIKVILELGRTQIISVGWRGRHPLQVPNEKYRYKSLEREDYWNSVC